MARTLHSKKIVRLRVCWELRENIIDNNIHIYLFSYNLTDGLKSSQIGKGMQEKDGRRRFGGAAVGMRMLVTTSYGTRPVVVAVVVVVFVVFSLDIVQILLPYKKAQSSLSRQCVFCIHKTQLSI